MHVQIFDWSLLSDPSENRHFPTSRHDDPSVNCTHNFTTGPHIFGNPSENFTCNFSTFSSRFIVKIGNLSSFFSNHRGMPSPHEQPSALQQRVRQVQHQLVSRQFSVARNPHAMTISMVKRQPFTKEQPHLWCMHLVAQLATREISSDRTLYESSLTRHRYVDRIHTSRTQFSRIRARRHDRPSKHGQRLNKSASYAHYVSWIFTSPLKTTLPRPTNAHTATHLRSRDPRRMCSRVRFDFPRPTAHINTGTFSTACGSRRSTTDHTLTSLMSNQFDRTHQKDDQLKPAFVLKEDVSKDDHTRVNSSRYAQTQVNSLNSIQTNRSNQLKS